ncbi:SAVED domain-containing protein [Acinetobacter soli]|uniref:SAVED domain-containing protein n=1 Tax=Acinetobacter soli TaxID=487316 RepID=UPI001D1867F3|nr:SAVED domain-containing protein [Acinetobacter soli]
MGNGAIPNPESGRKFCARLQQLLHDLKNKHNTKRVHLLVCASNAACVFIGQAIDLHHPEIIAYDFAKETMVARLVIKNNGKTNELELPS